MTALGLRNNNPLNIRCSRDVFNGELPPVNDFKRFESIAFGYRAAFVVLGTYLSRGKNTITKILQSWSPCCENDTNGYIAFVERSTGVDRNKILTSQSGDDYIKIVSAMSQMECGVPASIADVKTGFKLQNKIA
jgi:hypothetical protein